MFYNNILKTTRTEYGPFYIYFGRLKQEFNIKIKTHYLIIVAWQELLNWAVSDVNITFDGITYPGLK